MPMKTKTKVIKILLTNIPLAAAVASVATYLGLLGAGLSGDALVQALGPAIAMNFFLAYVISFFVGFFVPCEQWGFAFAQSRGLNPSDGIKFGIAINLVVNTVYTLINSLILTYINAIIMQNAPLAVYIPALLGSFVPCWAAGFIVSLQLAPMMEKLARTITKDFPAQSEPTTAQ